MNASVVHQCPHREIVFNNTVGTIDTLSAILARGDYKIFLNFTEKTTGEMLLNMVNRATIVSSEIHSWG
jgi:hypothetical protein